MYVRVCVMHRFLNGRGGEQKSRWLQEGKVETFEEKNRSNGQEGNENRKKKETNFRTDILLFQREKKVTDENSHCHCLSLSMCDQIA